MTSDPQFLAFLPWPAGPAAMAAARLVTLRSWQLLIDSALGFKAIQRDVVSGGGVRGLQHAARTRSESCPVSSAAGAARRRRRRRGSSSTPRSSTPRRSREWSKQASTPRSTSPRHEESGGSGRSGRSWRSLPGPGLRGPRSPPLSLVPHAPMRIRDPPRPTKAVTA